MVIQYRGKAEVGQHHFHSLSGTPPADMKTDRLKALAVGWGIIPLKWQNGQYKYSFLNIQEYALKNLAIRA